MESTVKVSQCEVSVVSISGGEFRRKHLENIHLFFFPVLVKTNCRFNNPVEVDALFLENVNC